MLSLLHTHNIIIAFVFCVVHYIAIANIGNSNIIDSGVDSNFSHVITHACMQFLVHAYCFHGPHDGPRLVIVFKSAADYTCAVNVKIRGHAPA